MMKHRSLGTIVVAGLIALALIGTAFAATHTSSKPKSVSGIVVATTEAPPPQDLNNNGIPDWQESLAATAGAASSSDAYVAPSSLPPTEALAREIFASYVSAKNGTAFDIGKATAGIADAVAAQPIDVPPAKTYRIADLSIHTDVPIAAYRGALATAMHDASRVSEYELTTFARLAHQATPDDIATLKKDASIYSAIADRLAALQVPTALVTDHLGIVNDVSALAAATKGLALWTGDPLNALAAVNAFSAAEDGVTADLAALTARINVLEKKS
jgi:hypothetical protein